MIKITFLKKDETARKIYQTIWNNRNTWYLPYLRLAGGHFHGLHTYKTQTQLFVYEGCLYVERTKVNHVLINIPEATPAFTEDEINSTIVLEEVDFQRQKGQGKFLTEENLERRFELIEVKNPFDENCEMEPLAKLMAMHKTIMSEIEAEVEKKKNINNDGDKHESTGN